jgi:hypothetical protein
VVNDNTEKLWYALRDLYGQDLQAATITVLLKDGDTAFRFVSTTFPQEDMVEALKENT